MRVYLLTLGCDKNRVDGEVMGGYMLEAGYEATDTPEDAQVIVVNTCGFIKSAVEESIETILELAEYKRSGSCKKLIVAGCMAERYREHIMNEIPEADAVIGVAEYNKVAEVLGLNIYVKARNDESVTDDESAAGDESATVDDYYAKRLLLPVAHTVPVKIAEGCDNNCTYCTIPSIRGGYKSRPFEDIIKECEQLTERGAREIVLVAQDTALYGADIYGRVRLHELITELNKLEKLTWLRIMYAYPEHISTEIINAIADNDKVCKYIDMPIQHSHTKVLQRMGRKGTTEALREVVASLRDSIPDVVIRTTVMVGFPGETDDEFAHLFDFINEIGFDRLGAFEYSREDGTPAAKMRPQVKPSVKAARLDKIMRKQQEIHKEKQRELVGKVAKVMVDSVSHEPNNEGLYSCEGRTYRDAYDTDSIVTFECETAVTLGEVLDVEISGGDEYDLYG